MTELAHAFFYLNNSLRYRKVGGIHWIAIGRLRIAICWKREGQTL
jgi:hypothetical protein